MNCTRGIIGGLGCGLFGAVSGAIFGATGAGVLSAVGHAGYSVAEAAGAASLGSGLIHGVTGFSVRLFTDRPSLDDLRNLSWNTIITNVHTVIGGITLEAILATCGTTLAKALLDSIIAMPTSQLAAAVATGAGIGGGVFMVAGLAFCCASFWSSICKGEESVPDYPFSRI